jgi:hypothetical protein
MKKNKMKLKKITRWKRITNDILKTKMFVWRKVSLSYIDSINSIENFIFKFLELYDG